MELNFCFVKKWGGLSNANLNLSSRNVFEYDPDLNDLRIERAVLEPIEGFWGAGISDVTVIAGNSHNASASILELLARHALRRDSELAPIAVFGSNVIYNDNLLGKPTISGCCAEGFTVIPRSIASGILQDWIVVDFLRHLGFHTNTALRYLADVLTSVRDFGSVLLLVDESRMYLDHAGQRTLLLDLVNTISGLNEPRAMVQIVVAANSSLTVADAPPGSLVVTRTDEEGCSAILPMGEINTFGADPFHIYRDVFGINDNHLSALARSRMDEYFKPLIDGRKLTRQELQKARDFTAMVSDRMLQRKLSQLVDGQEV